MPHFFDPQALTPAQKARWDGASRLYDQVQTVNARRRLRALAGDDRVDLSNSGKAADVLVPDLVDLLQTIANGQGGNPKSALFARLLDGKPPLVIQPPTAYSYPWYEIIEDVAPQTVSSLHGQASLDEWIAPGSALTPPLPLLPIAQCAWAIYQCESPTKAIVAPQGWGELGFRFGLERTKVSARDSASRIVAHHNPALDRVATLSELTDLERWMYQRTMAFLVLAADPSAAAAYLAERSGLRQAVAQTELDAARQTLARRLADGLVQFPTPEEVDRVVEERVARHFLDGDIVVGENGELFFWEWRLIRLAPAAVADDIYWADRGAINMLGSVITAG